MAHISDFLSTVHGRLGGVRAARNVYAGRFAPGFNVLSLLRPDELRLSAVLAELLNPKGSHSQGRIFWDLFVQHFSIPIWASQAREFNVGIEVDTHRLVGAEQRRIDILIELDGGRFGVAIENKPWAAYQRRQVSDYLSHLSSCHPDGHLLIYLSGTERTPDPSSISDVERVAAIDRGSFRMASFDKLLPWLSACRNECEAPTVASFITEFENYIRAEFLGVRDMIERNAVVDAAMRSRESVEAALEIILAGAEIQEQLLRNLVTQLQAKVVNGGRSWRLTADQKCSDAYKGFAFQFNEADRYTIRFQFEQRGYRGFFVGVSKGKADLDLEEVRSSLNQEFNCKNGKENHWVWWAQLVTMTDWSLSTEPWQRIVSGELAEEIFSLTEKIYRQLEKDNFLSRLGMS